MILDNLYASEIRFSIVTEWDAGYSLGATGQRMRQMPRDRAVLRSPRHTRGWPWLSLAHGGPVSSRNDAVEPIRRIAKVSE